MKRIFFLTATLIHMALFAAGSFASDTGLGRIQDAVRNYIEANMPWQPGTTRVEFLSEEPEAIPRGRNVTLHIEPAGNADFIGDTVFMVRISSGGKFLRSETVRTRIEVLRDFVIATRTIRSGTILTEQNIHLTKKWVRRISPDAVSSLDEAVGRRITTQARSGMEISAYMLKDVPLVNRGKMVRVVYDNGPMRIVTIGLPEEDGAAGSIVRVRNITSNKIIYARVLGDSLVGVEL